jgi:hypothetical protein
MTPNELRDRIKRLLPRGPVTRSLERSISGGGMKVVWYANQREHLLGWLDEYDGPGYYGRKNPNRSAEFIYNHFQCAPGLLWLAEAAGVPRFALVKAKKAVLAGRSRTRRSAEEQRGAGRRASTSAAVGARRSSTSSRAMTAARITH